MGTTIPPELRVDAIKFKEEMQAKLEERLKGLPPEEELREMRQIVEEGPLGDFWRRLQQAKTPSPAGR
jgi:hypothetical protein